MFQTLRNTARSLLAGQHHNARTTSASTATAAATPAMAMSTTSAASNILFHNNNYNSIPDSLQGEVVKQTNAVHPHTEQTWENYGFDKKECGWGAWYLVP